MKRITKKGKGYDYAEYDFNVIVGAKVKIVSNNGYAYTGTLVMSNDLLIGLTIGTTGVFHYELKTNILSLTANITPRRMNLEQLKRFAEDETKQENADEWSLTIDKKGLSFDFSSEGHKGIGVYINVDQPLSCTDWGWKE